MKNNIRMMNLPIGILLRVENGAVSFEGDYLKIDAYDERPILVHFTSGPAFVLSRESTNWFVLPTDKDHSELEGHHTAWVLPQEVTDSNQSWMITTEGQIKIESTLDKVIATITSNHCKIESFECRPHSDPFGNRFRFQFAGGDQLEEALAGFYWGTMLPSVVERTRAKDYYDSDGFVLSTLTKDNYGGTYPDVDHEFQIKG
ncbi:MAG: hypothetical protein H7X86_10760, partial [Gorillibacterium sp.]|nr:hypothetical protein [Gorillibacterium sp.]